MAAKAPARPKAKAVPKSSPPTAPERTTSRLSSIDALRGFVMFWIIGGDQIFPYLSKTFGGGFVTAMAMQFDHVPWHGLVFYDLIFPTFMFLAGCSMPFSFEKHLANGGTRSSLYRKIFTRSAAIVALGLLYNGGLNFQGFAAMRWPGVLQRIGITYCLASLIYLGSSLRGRIQWAVGLLLAYWAIMVLIPVPGIGAGVLTPEGNLAGYVDRLWLQGSDMCCYSLGDNEGFLSTLPAIVTVILGGFAGVWLKSARPASKKAAGLALAGLLSVGVSLVWNPWFPINKNLWTSSFVLAAGGCSTLMLALFYWLIDIQGWKAWAFPLMLIGMNSITIYLGQEIINFGGIAKFFVGGVSAYMGNYGGLMMIFGELAAKIGFLWFLWRQKVFLRV
jgi:predicted acyltransferase